MLIKNFIKTLIKTLIICFSSLLPAANYYQSIFIDFPEDEKYQKSELKKFSPENILKEHIVKKKTSLEGINFIEIKHKENGKIVHFEKNTISKRPIHLDQLKGFSKEVKSKNGVNLTSYEYDSFGRLLLESSVLQHDFIEKNYSYTQDGFLDKILISHNGNNTFVKEYSYDQDALTQTEITSSVAEGGETLLLKKRTYLYDFSLKIRLDIPDSIPYIKEEIVLDGGYGKTVKIVDGRCADDYNQGFFTCERKFQNGNQQTFNLFLMQVHQAFEGSYFLIFPELYTYSKFDEFSKIVTYHNYNRQFLKTDVSFFKEYELVEQLNYIYGDDNNILKQMQNFGWSEGELILQNYRDYSEKGYRHFQLDRKKNEFYLAEELELN